MDEAPSWCRRAQGWSFDVAGSGRIEIGTEPASPDFGGLEAIWATPGTARTGDSTTEGSGLAGVADGRHSEHTEPVSEIEPVAANGSSTGERHSPEEVVVDFLLA